MSDPAGEPSAPSGAATSIPPASEKSVAAEAKKHVPSKLISLASAPERIILRLNKLLATPGGLSAFLSTFNYTLYLLTYLEVRSAPLQARMYALLSRLSGRPATGVPKTSVATQSSIANLATLLSQTRTTLRLFGLLPMYAWMRQLLQGPKPGQDEILYATSVTQCTLYIAFQFLENVGLLTDKAILPASYTARWTAKSGGSTNKIYLWAYRSWMAGLCCDFVRLAREAQLERNQRARDGEKSIAAASQEQKDFDQGWWSDLVVPLSWFPIGAQFSTVGGLPGFNLGIMGACGLMAGLAKTSALWAATADP